MHFLTSPIVQGLALGLLVTQAAAAPNNVKNPTYNTLMATDRSVHSDIMRRADPAAHSQVWVGRVETYRKQHMDTLTPEQSAVLDNSIEILNSEDKSGLPELKKDAMAAFGVDEAKVLLTTLDGTPPPKADVLLKRKPQCLCATGDDMCAEGYACKGKSKCDPYPDDCGTFWTYKCDGLCYSA